MASSPCNSYPLDRPITKEELLGLLDESYIRRDGYVSFPQANDMNKSLAVFDMLGRGDANAYQISAFMGFAYRQATYYTYALEFLGLVRRKGNWTFGLTGRGEDIYLLPPKEKCLEIARLILKHGSFHLFFQKAIEEGKIGKSKDALECMKQCGYVETSSVTSTRRSQTVKGWVTWILSLPDSPISD